MRDPLRDDGLEGRPGGGAPPRGTRALTAILPNGRTLWLEVEPSFAPATKLSQVARLAEDIAYRRQDVLRRQRSQIEALQAITHLGAQRLGRTRLRRHRTLRRRMAASNAVLERRLAKAAAEFRQRLHRQLAVDEESVRRLRRRDIWDKALLVTSWLLSSAYGQRGRPFGTSNLALAIMSLIWLAGDDVVDAIFGAEDAKSPYALRNTDAWSYIAPFANLLGGWWLLSDVQHQRFLTGRASITPGRFRVTVGPELQYRYRAEVDLSRLVAPAHLTDFANLTSVPVVATPSSVTWSPDGVAANAHTLGVEARVENAVLVLHFEAGAQDLRALPTDPFLPILGAVDIAWMVDTLPNPSS